MVGGRRRVAAKLDWKCEAADWEVSAFAVDDVVVDKPSSL